MLLLHQSSPGSALLPNLILLASRLRTEQRLSGGSSIIWLLKKKKPHKITRGLEQPSKLHLLTLGFRY